MSASLTTQIRQVATPTVLRRTFPLSWHRADPDAMSGIHTRNAAAEPTGDPVDVPHTYPPLSATVLRNSLVFATRSSEMLLHDAARADCTRYAVLGGSGHLAMLHAPAHIAAIMATNPDNAPSATGYSPLRPIVGPDSVLTSVGARHKQQRGLLLPRFHARAVTNYADAITRATDKYLRRWPLHRPIALADLAQQITLDVIMAAVFGIGDDMTAATPAQRQLRREIVLLLKLSTTTVAKIAQLANARREDPVGLTKVIVSRVDRATSAVIAERRAGGDRADDILSLLLDATTTDGLPLSDGEIRDELLTLVLAGHETTSHSTAWTFERLTRHRDMYHQVRDAVRSGDGDDVVSAVLNESMRSRPVVPQVARELRQPWRFGDHEIPAGTVAFVSIVALHHNDELYPQPFAFRPQRFLDQAPTPTTLMPFGGGNRRCLGASLAMAELRSVVSDILRRVDLQTHDLPPEKPSHRNVTMIPTHGGRVVATRIA